MANAAETGLELAVIGSGAAGFAAAIAARTRGAKVVMIERATVGGTCVNTGCVPSKALLAAAQARRAAGAAPFPGVRTEAGPVEFPALIGGKDAMVADMRSDRYVSVARELDWPILYGTARFAPGPVLEVTLNGGGVTTVQAAHYLVATGSAPWIPPMAGLVDGCYDTSTTALALPRLPASMIVVGGGYVGLEYGQLFANLGTRVTLVETLDRLAQTEEPEVGEAIEAVLAADGVETHTGTTITAARRSGDEHVLRATRGAEQFELRAERLLMATGRLPVTAGLGLERVGVRIGARGEIVVDEYLRTGNERIWAAGDVTGSPQFVYVAGAQGTAVAANALGGTVQRLDYRHLPRVTFTTPAIAAAGLTEAQAVAQGIDADCRVLPLRYVPRALVNRDTRGLIKLVADRRSGQVLGVHVLAEGAGELIATAVHVLAGGMTVHQLADGWCPYLTTAEGLKLAAKAYSTDVAKLSCCA